MNCFLSHLVLATFLGAFSTRAFSEVNKPQELSPGVWFHEGDIGRKGHCNNGWVIFEDFVLVIDANFPSGAKEILPKIQAQTSKPIRFAFDTHHHGDHSYANQFWHEQGASIVAHEGVLFEMKKYETGKFGNKPGRWEEAARDREDVAASRLRVPSVMFPKTMQLEDSGHRVEFHHFGTAHTHGDGFAWLPKERILFTGDACVNGPYNYMGDGNTEEWVKTLKAAQRLNPKTVCPGHGLVGGPEVLANQIAFIETLRSEVRNVSRKSPVEVRDSIDGIRKTIQSNPSIANYVGGMFPSQVEKVFVEMGGKPFPAAEAKP